MVAAKPALHTKNSSPNSSSRSPSASVMSLPLAPPTSATKQRKKPGPKPKPKVPKTMVIKLKISPEKLKSVVVEVAPNGVSDSPKATPVPTPPSVASPMPSTETLEGTLVPPGSGQKRKGVPGPKPGTKRARQPGAPPLKPGRKKMRLDPNAPGANTTKLGPKASTGAINDKLRALDRTGKPCKRWTKAGFTLKSFTGVTWTVPTWAAPKAISMPSSDVNTSTETATPSENASVAATSPDEKMQTDVTPVANIPTISLPPGITV